MNKKYTYDNRYFRNINTTEKAYWLGYLYADGHIRKRPYAVNLVSVDKEIIQTFKRCLQGNMPIYIDNRNENLAYCINITSKQMVKDLTKLNCLSPKSLTITFPKLKSNLIRHFIRGYFDGDGWVGNYKKKQKHFVFGICSGSKKFLQTIRAILYNELNFQKVSIYFSKTNCYSLIYGIAKRKEQIYKYLYNNASIFLARKRKIFEERL